MKRDVSLDVARGVCIILVVVGHILQFDTAMGIEQPLFNFIYSFHMPVFMLLAGYSASFGRDKVNISSMNSFIIKKSKQLALPFLVWGVLVMPVLVNSKKVWEIGDVFKNLMVSPDKGPWFLSSLWCIQLVYLLFCLLSNSKRKSSVIVRELLSFFVLFFLVLSAIFVCRHFNVCVGGVISAYLSPLYLFFFFLGYFVSRYWKTCLNNRHIEIVSIIAFVGLVPLFDFGQSGIMLKAVISLCAAFIVLKSSYKLVDEQGNFRVKIRTLLAFLGRNSLVIYLIHFLFVTNNHLMLQSNAFSTCSLFVILVIIAIIISLLSVCIAKALGLSKFLSVILFGK